MYYSDNCRRKEATVDESMKGGLFRLVNQSENSNVRRQAEAASKRRTRHVRAPRKHPN